VHSYFATRDSGRCELYSCTPPTAATFELSPGASGAASIVFGADTSTAPALVKLAGQDVLWLVGTLQFIGGDSATHLADCDAVPPPSSPPSPPPPTTHKTVVMTGTSGCYVDLPNIQGASTFAAFTIEMWVKTTSDTGDASGDPVAIMTDIATFRVNYPAGSGGRPYFAAVDSRTGGTGDQRAADCIGAHLNTGTWYHLAMTVSSVGSYPVVYINGVQQTCTHSTDNPSGTYFADLIGGHSESNTNPSYSLPVSNAYRFQGEMSDIRIWSVVRTASQIANNMDTFVDPTTANLAAHFQFATDSGASGSTCTDATGTYSGQYTGTCAIADRPPPPPPIGGRAVVMTGTSGCYVDLPNIQGASTFAAFTIEMWVKTTSDSGDASGDPVALWTDIGSIRPNLGGGGGRPYMTAIDERTGGTGTWRTADCIGAHLNTGTWYHLAMTVSSVGSYPVVYIDGVA
jgi:hypothetical protein